jgi:zinc D-Ala-D-Ala carboxypeptidase
MKAQWEHYPNFTKEEFDCKHTGKNEMEHEFMAKLQALRTAYGKPMRITSGFRDYAHPVEAKKPRKNGAHPTGKACDIAIDRKEAYELLKVAMQLGFTGIGCQQNGSGRFIHLDTIEDNSEQPRPSIWSY